MKAKASDREYEREKTVTDILRKIAVYPRKYGE